VVTEHKAKLHIEGRMSRSTIRFGLWANYNGVL